MDPAKEWILTNVIVYYGAAHWIMYMLEMCMHTNL